MSLTCRQWRQLLRQHLGSKELLGISPRDLSLIQRIDFTWNSIAIRGAEVDFTKKDFIKYGTCFLERFSQISHFSMLKIIVFDSIFNVFKPSEWSNHLIECPKLKWFDFVGGHHLWNDVRDFLNLFQVGRKGFTYDGIDFERAALEKSDSEISTTPKIQTKQISIRSIKDGWHILDNLEIKDLTVIEFFDSSWIETSVPKFLEWLSLLRELQFFTCSFLPEDDENPTFLQAGRLLNLFSSNSLSLTYIRLDGGDFGSEIISIQDLWILSRLLKLQQLNLAYCTHPGVSPSSIKPIFQDQSSWSGLTLFRIVYFFGNTGWEDLFDLLEILQTRYPFQPEFSTRGQGNLCFVGYKDNESEQRIFDVFEGGDEVSRMI
jgi:hypothetical protein